MHSVYMITDRAGALMYIGCTSDIYRRQAHHRSKSPWFAHSWMIHHKPYGDREYAERVEARAIRRYRPPHNKRGNPDWVHSGGKKDCRHSERTKAGLAAKAARGETLGRPHLIRDDKKRMKHMRKLQRQGKLFDEKGKLLLVDRELWNELNKGNPDAPVGSLETVRRWRRDGFPGLQEDQD